MTIKMTLYKCLSADNVINKELTDPLEVDINLRSESDLNFLNVDLVDVDVLSYNYAVLELPTSPGKPVRPMCYVIRDMEWVNARVARVRLGVDLLETYKDEILNIETRLVRELKVGDYGEVVYELSGRNSTDDYISDVAVEPGETFVLSVLRGVNRP